MKRVLRSRSAAAASGAAVAVALFGGTVALANHNADVIHACQKTQNGTIRIVGSASDCASNETALE